MTILTAPGNYASAHYDLFYVVSDAKAADPVTYPNYKYVADVYINGNFITRLRRFPDPVNNFGVFNIGAIVRSYINASFSPASGVLKTMELAQGQFNSDIQLHFGEEYALTTTYNIVTDSVRTAYNYYLRLPQGTNTPLASFVGKIVTNGNIAYTVKSTLGIDFLFINYLPANTSAITITVTGNSVYTTTITPANVKNLLVFNISPVLLNILQPGIITGALDFYTVQIGTEIIKVNLFCESMYKVYPIHFLNQWGGFETAIFNKLSRQSTKVDKKSFGTLPYSIANDGSVNYRDASTAYYESEYNYASTFNKTMVLNSDILTDLEYNWLEDLIESPLVYIQMLGSFYPVKITNTDYEIRKQINETDLTNLTLNLDLGRTFNSQYR